MDETRENELIQLLGSKGTRRMLQYLSEQGKAQYKDLNLCISVSTLNKRLPKLLEFGIIEHHFRRDLTRQEWYEITEKGRKILKCLEVMVRLFGE